jgi:CHASE3 domain sensor protein
MKDVRELTSDNPFQQRALDHLEPIVLDRLEAAHEQIEIRTRDGAVAGAESMRIGSGRRLMDQAREGISQMEQEEKRLLILRTEEMARSSRSTRTMILTGGVLAVGFLCLARVVVAQKIM